VEAWISAQLSGMTESIPEFQNRAARLLAADPLPPLDSLDRVITDGCAEVLTLETELRRVDRRRDEALERANGSVDTARAVVELGNLRHDLEERLEKLQHAVRELMDRRSRLHLHDSAAPR
jgi:hypothetical protein